MSQDLRSFLAQVQAHTPEEVLVVREPVEPRYVVTSVVAELAAQHRYPILVFENVNGSAFPVVTNVMASRERFALPMGVPVAEVSQEYARRVKREVAPRLVADGPVQDVVLTGAAVDVGQLPIVTHFPVDGGPYITAGLVFCRDPHEPAVNTFGFHRIMYRGEGDRLGISLHSRRRVWEYQRRAEERGEPLEVAVVLGTHPLLALASLSLVGPDRGKLETAGALLDEPIDVVRARTVDVLVPADAEMVIEGEILPDTREEEGPFGEFTGYAAFRSTRHVLQVKAITHRHGALYQSVTGGYTPEHIVGLGIQREGDVYNALRASVPTIKAVHIPYSGCSIFHAYISLKKTAEGQPLQAIAHALGMDHGIKLVVVVDEDVDVYNEADVWWAMSTRLQAGRGVHVLRGGMGVILDPSATEGGVSDKLGIDATKPLAGFAERLHLPDDARARARELIDRLAPAPAIAQRAAAR
jgi:2,5-furandicarboxylate decarboxylase 1